MAFTAESGPVVLKVIPVTGAAFSDITMDQFLCAPLLQYPVSMYGNHFQQSMDQTGKVADSARGQLNRENSFFPIPFAPDDLVS